MELEGFVNKCLAKTVSGRYSSAAELGTDLRTVAERLKSGEAAQHRTQALPAGHSQTDSASTSTARRERIVWSTALALALAVIVIQTWRAPSRAPDAAPKRFAFVFEDLVKEPVVSPDGRHIAYVQESGDNDSVWVQDLDRDEPRKIADVARIQQSLGWSPDSSAIVYRTSATILARAPLAGGSSQTVSQTMGVVAGCAWAPDGQSLVFSSNDGLIRRLYTVAAQRGSPEKLFEPEPTLQNRSYYDPQFIPGASSPVLLYAFRDGPGGVQIGVRDLATGHEETLSDGRRPVYSPTGHVIFELDDALWALPFSVESLLATGEPFLVRENASRPSVAADGSLVYLSSGPAGAPMQLVWIDSEGRELGTIGQPQKVIQYPELSPDQTRVAVRGVEGDDDEVWIHDVSRPLKTRVTFSPGRDSRPLWSDSGGQILFSSLRADLRTYGIYRKAADGSGEAQLVHSADMNTYASDESADGRYVFYDKHAPMASATTDIWYLELQGDGTFSANPFLAREFNEKAATISPDGLWLAYVSEETGESEVYAQRFPSGGGKVRVSSAGGAQPRWGHSGDKIYFVSNGTLFSAEAQLGADLAVSEPAPIGGSFRLHTRSRTVHPHYDVSADGKRFVVPRQVDAGRPAIRITQNWHQEFRGRD